MGYSTLAGTGHSDNVADLWGTVFYKGTDQTDLQKYTDGRRHGQFSEM